jgi:hypothetical protein
MDGIIDHVSDLIYGQPWWALGITLGLWMWCLTRFGLILHEAFYGWLDDLFRKSRGG